MVLLFVLPIPKQNFSYSFSLLFAIDFSLVQSKILSFGKELMLPELSLNPYLVKFKYAGDYTDFYLLNGI